MSRRDDAADARRLLADLRTVGKLGRMSAVVAASFVNGFLSDDAPTPVGPVLAHPAPIVHNETPALVIEVADLVRLLEAFFESGGGL